MSEWFIVNDIVEFTDKARAIVYNNFGEWKDNTDEPIGIEDVSLDEQDDFNKVLSHEESLVIIKQLVKKEKHKKTKKVRYILNDEIFSQIIYDLNTRMVSNILNSLVQKGLVESAFDSEINDFVFWTKENTDFEKPETD
jgi:DNA-binding HxlR family transcriptional regulator